MMFSGQAILALSEILPKVNRIPDSDYIQTYIYNLVVLARKDPKLSISIVHGAELIDLCLLANGWERNSFYGSAGEFIALKDMNLGAGPP